jgi:transposase-like protein
MDAANRIVTAHTFDVDATDAFDDFTDGQNGQKVQPTRAGGNDDPEWRAAAMERFLAVIRNGLSISAAARAAGIARNATYVWKDKYPDFAEKLADAIEEGLDLHEDRIAAAGNYDYRASVAFLRAKRPDVWGNRVQATTDATVKLDGKLDVDARIAELLQADVAWLAACLDTKLPGMK